LRVAARGAFPPFSGFYFALDVTILLVPTAIQAYDTVLHRVTLSDSTRGLIYCVYGEPILMMLFLKVALEIYRAILFFVASAAKIKIARATG
jgi:hypothetical protein